MFKRIFDLVASLLVLLLIWPVLLVIAILVKLDSKGPIIFKQIRVGKSQELFKIWKFRTMRTGAGGAQITVGEDSRITKIGHILRRFKLDEFPQLFNIIKGEMSVVGPRPEVPKYVNYYTTEQLKVLVVRPGLTDLASLKFINEAELLAKSVEPEKTYVEEIMPQKLSLNLDYIEQQSLLLDLRIIGQTLLQILR